MTELEKVWKGARDMLWCKNLMNTEQNGQANDRLLPNIIVLTRANGELAIMKALRKETYRYPSSHNFRRSGIFP
jgi:hypothetical protein